MTSRLTSPSPAPAIQTAPSPAPSPLTTALAIADAVLFEGYVLYPYRADDPKNTVRWQFGVLAPPGFVEQDRSERSRLQTDTLLEGADVTLTVRSRFLHVQRRRVQAWEPGQGNSTGDGFRDDGFRDVDRLDVGDATYLPLDEAVLVDSTSILQLGGLGAHRQSIDIEVPGGTDTEALTHDGTVVGRLVRDRLPLTGTLLVEATPMPGPYGVRRLRMQLENSTAWTADGSTTPHRPEALRRALVAAHLLVEAEHGAFVSLIDTPEWAREYAEQCEQVGTFPVLAGPRGDRSLLLASPIILYDHPEVAPESVSQFCDGTEMDEMLTLRTLTLTDEEKRHVRGSDPRAAALVDQIDDLPPDLMNRLHGAIRSMSAVARPATPQSAPVPESRPWWSAEAEAQVDPDTDVVVIAGIPVGRGAAVRLRPGARRADAQDMFLEGRAATVEAVVSDVDGGCHLAVSLDDITEGGVNPHGRYLYFAPDEVEPIRTVP